MTADTPLDPLEHRLRAILPEEYQDSYEDVQPVSMGSAGLKFGADGKVAWNEMWATFCDLAMAGGPPHKGMLLEPGTPGDVAAAPERYAAVVEEIARGVWLVSGLEVQASGEPGWVRLLCATETMAAWLLRAIVMENVAVRADGRTLDLPAAPHFRIEKEIKNVVTVVAKTTHYWAGHMRPVQQRVIGQLFAEMEQESPLIVPGTGAADRAGGRYTGWRAVACPSVRAAVWMMRMLIVSNVLARREGTDLLVPVNAAQDPDGNGVASRLAYVQRLAVAKGVMA
jgi:hypothetical protein